MVPSPPLSPFRSLPDNPYCLSFISSYLYLSILSSFYALYISLHLPSSTDYFFLPLALLHSFYYYTSKCFFTLSFSISFHSSFFFLISYSPPFLCPSFLPSFLPSFVPSISLPTLHLLSLSSSSRLVLAAHSTLLILSLYSSQRHLSRRLLEG